MNSKFINCTLIAILVSLCYSCAFNPTRAEVSYANGTINVSNVSSNNTVISISVCGKLALDTVCTSSLSLSILDAIDRSSLDKIELAAYATEHNNTLPVQVKIGKQVDSFGISLSPYYPQQTQSSIEGKCAPLTPKLLDSDKSMNVKKWLYKHKKRFTDDQITNLMGIMNKLSVNSIGCYVPVTDIPILKSLSNITYRVNSAIEADYYVLYACENEEEIDEFVGDVVVNDFKQCTTSLKNSMFCFTKKYLAGYKCICLLAINKDWNYTIEPLAWVAIDTQAPINPDTDNIIDLFHHDIKPDTIYFSNGKTVLPPRFALNLWGKASVSILHWDGNGISCNCTFSIKSFGDVTSVTIVRENKLAKYLSKERKKIYLIPSDTPYTFIYDLHFEDGDNIIPIEVEDFAGNVTKQAITVRAKFVRTNSNDVYIDNNITVY